MGCRLIGVGIRGAGLLIRNRLVSWIRRLCLCSRNEGRFWQGGSGLAVFLCGGCLLWRWFRADCLRCWGSRPFVFVADSSLGQVWCGGLSPGRLDTVEITVHLGDTGNLWCPFFTGSTGRRRLGANRY